MTYSRTAKKTQRNTTNRYFDQFYQIWNEYMWVASEKWWWKESATICWEQNEHRRGFNDNLINPKDWKHMGYLPQNTAPTLFQWLITQRQSLYDQGQAGEIILESIGLPPMGPTGYVWQTCGCGCHQDGKEGVLQGMLSPMEIFYHL